MCGEEAIEGREVRQMSTKELSKNYPLTTKGFFDFPSRLDWFDDIAPLGMFFRTPELKPIKIEQFVKDGKLIVRAELPGVDPDKDIDVSLHEGYLTIKGERKEEMKDEHHSEFMYGSFSRTIALPSGFDQKSVHANYKDGILEVSLGIPVSLSNGKKIPISRTQ